MGCRKIILKREDLSFHQEVEDKLPKDLTGYVLITCKSPSTEGEMAVEMSFDGDPALVSCMLSQALKTMENTSENPLS